MGAPEGGAYAPVRLALRASAHTRQDLTTGWERVGFISARTLGEDVEVREATYDDVPWLLEQLREFSRFFNSRLPLFPDDAAAEAGIRLMILDHVVIIAEDVEGRAGFIAGFIGPHPFNPKIVVLNEAFWWVSQDRRKSRAALLLLNAFKAEGRRYADWITMSLEADSPVNDSALTKRGFALKERSYIFEVVREAS